MPYDNIIAVFQELVRAGVQNRTSVHFPDCLFQDRELSEDFEKFASWQLGRSIQISGDISNENLFNQELFPGYAIPNAQLAICYGVGVDSTIALWWARKKYGYQKHQIAVVHVDYGWASKKEQRRLDDLLPYLTRQAGSVIKISLDPPVVSAEDSLPKGYIIPARNALLASIGQQYGDLVWIVANYRKIDDGKHALIDKNRRFFLELGPLLSRFRMARGFYSSPKEQPFEYDYIPQRRNPVVVMSPFLHLSKGDTIRWFLEVEPEAKKILSLTTTCYDSERQRCGRCAACFKLALTLQEVGLYGQPGFCFDHPPNQEWKFWTSSWKRFLDSSREHGRSH